MGAPLVTIAIPTADDEPRIRACLDGARAQDYPKERIQIVVADAMSMDATRELVIAAAEEDPRIRLVDNPWRTRAAGLQMALEEAEGEILVPMDPGADYARTHVSKCVRALESPAVDGVLVVPRTLGRTLRERALSAVQKTALAYATPRELAVGAAAEPGVVGAVRKEAASFDPGSKAGEDADLARKLGDRGAHVVVGRDIVVHRTEASTFKELFKKHWRYGESRARAVLDERRVKDPRELAPPALVAIGSALLLTSAIQPFTGLAAAAYALKTGAAAVRIAKSEGLTTLPFAWAAYPVMHAAHGVGFVAHAASRVRARLRKK